MTLSNRASHFLKKQQWRKDAVKSESVILAAFAEKNVVPTKEVIDFQMKYGGVMIYVGLEPICFGIIHGEQVRGHEFGGRDKKIHQIDHYDPDEPDEGIPAHHFTCADTLYQEFFAIDEKGNYYETYDLKATNFGYLVEDLALYDEVWEMGLQKMIEENVEEIVIEVQSIFQDLHLKPYPDFPVDLIHWGMNDEMIVRISPDKVILFSESGENLAAENYIKNLVGKKAVIRTPRKNVALDPPLKLSLQEAEKRVSTTRLIHSHIESILLPYQALLGKAYIPYKNHVHRICVYTMRLKKEIRKHDEFKIAIAAVFHDIGIWTADTFDYLEPSISAAQGYLEKNNLTDWSEEIRLTIDMHHKRSKYAGKYSDNVESFRKADFIDLTAGMKSFGINRNLIEENLRRFPMQGFRGIIAWMFIKNLFIHPLNPLPMFKK